MDRRAAMVMMLVVVALASSTTPSHAIDRPCSDGQTWDPNQGACIDTKEAPKLSPQEGYYRALEILEGKHGHKRAIPLLEESCRRGHGPACTQLGFVFKTGRHVGADPVRSLAHYSRGCELKDLPGCLGAAEHHAKALGGSPNFDAALSFYQAACSLGSGSGCFRVAEAYQLGRGTKVDAQRAAAGFAKAAAILERECQADNGPSCHLLGLALRDGRGTKRNPSRAFVMFARGCESGSGDACYEKGVSLRDGAGTTRDGLESQRVFEDACARYDSGDACFAAGQLLASHGVDADEKKILEALGSRACDLDHKHCLLMARLIDTGVVTSPSPNRSLELANMACDHGNGLACFDAAIKFIEGSERIHDVPRGIERMQRSCSLDYAVACEQLAVYAEDGTNVAHDEARAHTLRAQACILGYGPSCTIGGQMAMEGRGLQKGKSDPTKALAYFRLGCEVGEGEACVEAGHLFLPRNDAKSIAEAESFYREACSKDYAAGCVAVGQLFLEGRGRKTDRNRARRWFLEACIHGDEAPCSWAISLAPAGGDPEVGKTLERACELESPNEGACLALARELTRGSVLVEQDERRAFRLIEPSCRERGYHPACIFLADLYRDGLGTIRAPDKALSLLVELCQKDVPTACTKLAHSYLADGSYRAALPLYRRACSDGDPSACNNFAYAHYIGRGTEWSVDVAMRYWSKACDGGSATGCANLGDLLEHGVGGASDPAKAVALYQQSCTIDEVAGCGPLGRLKLAGATDAAAIRDALGLLQRACESRVLPDPSACRLLVDHHRQHGRGAPSATVLARLAQRTVDLARQRAEKNPYFAYLLGTYLRDGFAVPRDRDAAIERFVQACDGYDPYGCMAAGEAFAGRGKATNLQRAEVYYQRACAAAMTLACERAQTIAARPVPMANRKGAPGCACNSTGGPTGWPALVVVALLLVRRRRR